MSLYDRLVYNKNSKDEDGNLILKGKSGLGLGKIGANALIGGAASAIGSAISGKFAGTTSGGKFLKGAGALAATLPGPMGAIGSAALGIAGGVFDRTFGIHENAEAKANNQQAVSSANNAAMAASTAQSFDSEALQGLTAAGFQKVYTGGLASKGKAAEKNAAERAKFVDARSFADRSIANAADRIATAQMDNAQAGWYALGGPLIATGGAIDYAFMNDYLTNGYIRALQSGKEPVVQQSPANKVYAYGGDAAKSYIEGGIYNVSPREYNRLLEDGYKIQVINE